MTKIGIDTKSANSAPRVVLHYNEPAEWKSWSVDEGVNNWTYQEMTFFFSCDAVFGEGAPCIAVLSKDIAYSDDGYRELVMDEQMYENVLSAASEVTSNAIVGGF